MNSSEWEECGNSRTGRWVYEGEGWSVTVLRKGRPAEWWVRFMCQHGKRSGWDLEISAVDLRDAWMQGEELRRAGERWQALAPHPQASARERRLQNEARRSDFLTRGRSSWRSGFSKKSSKFGQ